MSSKPDYHHALVERIKDRELWPDFDQPHFLSELNEVADEAWEKQTIEGFLASLLIYHQLAEEMLRLLLRCSEFFVQLQLFPTEIHFPAREKIMFGRVIDALKETIEFENKAEIVRLANSLNDRRVALVHGLTKHSSLDEIKSKAVDIKSDFDALYNAYEETHDWFLLYFKDLRKDGDWNEYFNED